MTSIPSPNKALVRRLIEEAVNKRDLAALNEIAHGDVAQVARGWILGLRAESPDVRMEIVDLIGEDDKVVGHFRCSGTPPSEDVDVVYIFRVRRGKLTATATEEKAGSRRKLGVDR